jgi:hypothetical protein
MKKAISTGQLNWENLSFWDKFELFDKWLFISFAGDLLLLFGTLFFQISDYVNFFKSEFLIGLGTFFIWIRALEYFQGSHPYNLFLRTLAIASPTLIKVFVGVAPFIIGSGFLA